jgi:hypothetical protein
METAKQLFTATAVTKADRNGALGCWSPSIPCGVAAATAALATCVLLFAPAVFAQPASDSLGVAFLMRSS